MTITVYDLAGADPRQRFSPYCWRTKLALAHKGLAFETVATRFSDISGILDGSHRSVPVLVDDGEVISDSWRIAEYLETRYVDQPSLFGGEAGLALARFVDGWGAGAVYGRFFPMVVKDIWDKLDAENQTYFRQSREKRLGKALEEAQASRDKDVVGFRKGMVPLRNIVADQPFLSGGQPAYADYIVFAGFIWAMAVSSYRWLEDDDPLAGWLERCFDLYGGMAREIL